MTPPHPLKKTSRCRTANFLWGEPAHSSCRACNPSPSAWKPGSFRIRPARKTRGMMHCSCDIERALETTFDQLSLCIQKLAVLLPTLRQAAESTCISQSRDIPFCKCCTHYFPTRKLEHVLHMWRSEHQRSRCNISHVLPEPDWTQHRLMIESHLNPATTRLLQEHQKTTS